MVNVDIDLSKWKLKIDGHANFDEEGKDIVCSAISILFYTAVQTFNDFEESLRLYKKKITKGGGMIIAKPKESYIPNIALIFMTITNGYRLIESEYPNHIKVNIKE